MKKVYLIGDCHSIKIYDYHDRTTSPVDLKIWAKGGYFAWKFSPEKLARHNEASSMIADKIDQRSKVVNWNIIKDDGILVAWLGYIDIKNLLPRYENAEDTVKKYVENLVEYFPNSIIKIIEPHPQFVDFIVQEGEGWRVESYEDRKYQNDEFLKFLRIYAASYNIEIIITQQEILDIVDPKEITGEIKTMSRDGNRLDSLSAESYEAIYKLFISKVLKV